MNNNVKNKREQWESVQNKAPEIAEFMTLIAKAFGKPASVKVELNSGAVILNSGVKKSMLTLSHFDIY